MWEFVVVECSTTIAEAVVINVYIIFRTHYTLWSLHKILIHTNTIQWPESVDVVAVCVGEWVQQRVHWFWLNLISPEGVCVHRSCRIWAFSQCLRCHRCTQNRSTYSCGSFTQFRDPIINSNYKFMVQCIPSLRLMRLSGAHRAHTHSPCHVAHRLRAHTNPWLGCEIYLFHYPTPFFRRWMPNSFLQSLFFSFHTICAQREK